jgi:hypothetical protein
MDSDGDISRSTLAFVVAAVTHDPAADVTAPQVAPAVADLTWVSIAPGTAAADAPGPTDPAWAGYVARAAVDHILHQHAEDDAADPEPGMVFRRLDLDRFVEDLVAAPARWPVPLPILGSRRWWPRACRSDGGLDGRDLLVAAAEIELGREWLDTTHPLRQHLAEAAGRLMQEGLDRLRMQALDRTSHDLFAKHEWASPLVSLAKHR